MKKWPGFLVPAILLCTSGAIAQDAVLEEVIVTAQKREQSLQDVPISVSAVTGDVIAAQNVTRLDEISRFVPNLQINENFTGSALNIRGISSGVGNAGFEQSVATFIDGVYFGRSRQSIVPFLDVQQVEVLRGPQPVFFGNSAIAGALNITTRRPSLDEWEGSAQLSLATDAEYGINAAVGGPIAENFGIRLAGRVYSWDGWMTNSASSADYPERENETFRISALYETDTASAFFKFETASNDQVGVPSQITNCGQGGISPSAPPFLPVTGNVCEAVQSLGAYDVEFRQDDRGAPGPNTQTFALGPGGLGLVDIADNSAFGTPPETLDADNAALDLNFDLGGSTLTLLTGWSEYDSFRQLDVDNQPVVYFTPRLREDFEQFSQEIRLTSNEPAFDGGLDWMLGLYYQDAELNFGNQALITVIPQIFAGPGVSHNEESTWISGFAAGTLHVSDRARIGLGLRYTEVEKDGTTFSVEGTRATVPNPLFGNPMQPPVISDYSAPNFILSEFSTTAAADACLASGMSTNGVCYIEPYDTDSTDYSIDFQYDFNDSVLGYISVSEAFKAGGFNVGNSTARTLDAYIYDDETAFNIEAGAKMSFDRLNLNIAVFTTDYEDLQVSAFDPQTISFNVTNAGESTATGIEFDGRFAASDRWLLTFSGAWLDAEYDQFDGAQCSDFERNNDIGNCDFVFDPGTGALLPDGSVTSRAGFPLNYAPEIVLNAGVLYTAPISSSLEFEFGADVNYSDEYWVNDRYDPRGIQDSYAKVNVTLGLRGADDRWSIMLLGRNITDEQLVEIYGPSVFNGTEAAFLITSRGESYALQGRYSFF